MRLAKTHGELAEATHQSPQKEQPRQSSIKKRDSESVNNLYLSEVPPKKLFSHFSIKETVQLTNKSLRIPVHHALKDLKFLTLTRKLLKILGIH